MQEIREADWKVVRELHEIAMARFFERSVAGMLQKLSKPQETHKERFWAVHDQVKEEAKDAAEMFDGLRRSTAFLMVLRWRSEGLLKAEDFERCSPEFREQVNGTIEEFKSK